MIAHPNFSLCFFDDLRRLDFSPSLCSIFRFFIINTLLLFKVGLIIGIFQDIRDILAKPPFYLDEATLKQVPLFFFTFSFLDSYASSYF